MISLGRNAGAAAARSENRVLEITIPLQQQTRARRLEIDSGAVRPSLSRVDSGPVSPSSPFLTAEWRWLAMLNYRVEPALRAPRVPAGVELDVFEGMTLMSLVGFRFLGTRVLGVSVPLHRDFDEVNLRFYVRRRMADGWRRGVVFVRELVPRVALAAVARFAYREPYRAVPMRHAIEDEGRRVSYSWRWRRQWCSLALTTAGPGGLPEPGSEASFITEHFWGYSAAGRRTREYQVEHPSWTVRPALVSSTSGDLASVYGHELGAALARSPRSAFLAEGSGVLVRQPTWLS